MQISILCRNSVLQSCFSPSSDEKHQQNRKADKNWLRGESRSNIIIIYKEREKKNKNSSVNRVLTKVKVISLVRENMITLKKEATHERSCQLA